MNRNRLTMITQAALIAALYVALTYVFQPISFGEVQIRIAEALTILPVFHRCGRTWTLHRLPAG